MVDGAEEDVAKGLAEEMDVAAIAGVADVVGVVVVELAERDFDGGDFVVVVFGGGRTLEFAWAVWRDEI